MLAVVGVIASSVVFVQPVLAASNHTTEVNETNTRPGWGFGDDNHIHTGPPGHSVHPGDGDNDNDDHGHHNGFGVLSHLGSFLNQAFGKFLTFFHHGNSNA